jgi:hypothetical protein
VGSLLERRQEVRTPQSLLQKPKAASNAPNVTLPRSQLIIGDHDLSHYSIRPLCAYTGNFWTPESAPHHVRHEIDHKRAHLVHRAATIQSGSQGHDAPFEFLRSKRICSTAHSYGWITTLISNPTNTPTRNGPSCDSGRRSTTLFHQPKPQRHIQVPRSLARRTRRRWNGRVLQR